MGEVYRARETRLDRIAIKVSKTEFSERFEGKALSISALNRPHILTVHYAGKIDGRQYLVTEFIDRGTLADWAPGEKRTWSQRQIVSNRGRLGTCVNVGKYVRRQRRRQRLRQQEFPHDS